MSLLPPRCPRQRLVSHRHTQWAVFVATVSIETVLCGSGVGEDDVTAVIIDRLIDGTLTFVLLSALKLCDELQ